MPILVCIVIGVLTAPYFSLSAILALAGGIYLFFSGLEIDLKKIGVEAPLIFKLWLGAFVPPFVIGFALPHFFPSLFSSPDGVSFEKTALTVGIALAVSAVPVVIKIMDEIGWTGTLRAQRVVLTAVFCDIAAWILFFMVLPSAGQTPWLVSHWPLFMFFIGLVAVYFWPNLTRKLLPLVKLNKWIVATVFFVGVGQALDLKLGVNWTQITLIFFAATISKSLGVWAMGKHLKLPTKENFALSITLNARGAMEVLMAKFALAAGVITNDLFVSLVFMALATSLVIKPIFRWTRWF